MNWIVLIGEEGQISLLGSRLDQMIRKAGEPKRKKIFVLEGIGGILLRPKCTMLIAKQGIATSLLPCYYHTIRSRPRPDLWIPLEKKKKKKKTFVPCLPLIDWLM